MIPLLPVDVVISSPLIIFAHKSFSIVHKATQILYVKIFSHSTILWYGSGKCKCSQDPSPTCKLTLGTINWGEVDGCGVIADTFGG